MGRKDAGAPLRPELSTRGLGQAYVRVTGTRLDRYVEFEFSVNDADLTVELILPFAAFDEFCRQRGATVLPPEPEAAQELEKLAWRTRQPGLLRRVRNTDSGAAPETARRTD